MAQDITYQKKLDENGNPVMETRVNEDGEKYEDFVMEIVEETKPYPDPPIPQSEKELILELQQTIAILTAKLDVVTADVEVIKGK